MRRLVAFGLAAGLPAAAGAGELSFDPYAAVLYQQESNVYHFSRQVAEVTGTDDTEDRSLRYTAGADAAYAWPQQRLQAVAELRRVEFDDFTALDHDEHLFGIAFDGGILGHTRALLDVREERRMASFADRRSTQLVLERDQWGRGEVAVAVTPAWRIVTGARGRNLRSPLPAAPALPNPPPGAPARPASPDFGVHEAGFNAGVLFGIENKEHPEHEAPLVAGLVLDYQAVSFSGVTPPPPPPDPLPPPLALTPEERDEFQDYALWSLVATARYAASGLSILDGKLGVTLFDPERATADARPELTAEVGYTRKLSAATELNAHVFRRIVPYVATADATTDTGVSAGFKWEPLRSFTVLGNYAWASSAFEGLSAFAPEDSGRSDDVQEGTLSFAYPVEQLLYARLFGRYSDRHSNLGYNDYNATTVGLELSVRFGKKRAT